MITLKDYYMGRDVTFEHELTDELRANATKIVARASELLAAFGQDRKVSSGWRPSSVNSATPGASKKSNHMYCLAVDLSDSDGSLDQWCLDNVERLREIGLWLESPSNTPGWCHVQCVPPKSGHIVFMP